MLVNNVGMNIPFTEFHAVKDESSLSDIVNCNVVSMLRMCHIVLPQMVQRKRGVVVNIGSVAGIMPTPFRSTYGATKVSSILKKFDAIV